MRTSVNISDALMARAREEAARRGTTLRALIEEGLRAVLDARPEDGFVLEDASFQGPAGYAPGVDDANVGQRIAEVLAAGRDG